MLLGINKQTVLRKLVFLGRQASMAHLEMLIKRKPVGEWEFDDQETFEQTKCKPLSITLAVEAKTRCILGFVVSQMPAKGKLAHKAKKKYGKRVDLRAKGRKKLFKRLVPFIKQQSLVRSDMSPHYPKDVKRFFPGSIHETVKGKRGATTGQGELKKAGFDPLFSLNHTFAMFRENINRLKRKTWCTTKKPLNLSYHIAIYMQFHNESLI